MNPQDIQAYHSELSPLCQDQHEMKIDEIIVNGKLRTFFVTYSVKQQRGESCSADYAEFFITEVDHINFMGDRMDLNMAKIPPAVLDAIHNYVETNHG